MLTYPEIQARAQKELDSVVGRDRLPEFSDRDSLPYLSAILKEVLRYYFLNLSYNSLLTKTF